MKQPRVAICQPYFILGGRLAVVLGIAQAFNQLGIEPEILSLGFSFTPDEIQKKYGQDLRVKFRSFGKFMPWRPLSQDIQILIFNYLLKIFAGRYDLLVDSGNSRIFLPDKPQVISYIHFPREARYLSPSSKGKVEGEREYGLKPDSIPSRFYRWIYSKAHIQPGHILVCNSEYTLNSLKKLFSDIPNELSVIYPPVNLCEYQSEISENRHGIISMGRFSPGKMQLEQIKVAENMPDIDFHLVGFVNSPNYFKQCQAYVREHQLKHVYLHPNMDYADMLVLLKKSKYFLHTQVNEPFGITAVEAIAAGCLPLVHDSGGQRETVFFNELRYHSIQEIPAMLASLEKKKPAEIGAMISRLQQHARLHFDKSVFDEKIGTLLTHVVESVTRNSD